MAVLEEAVNRAFGLVFNLDPMKRACITSNMNARDKVHALRAGINLVENDTQRKVNPELNEALKSVDRLNGLRNDLFHNALTDVFLLAGKMPLSKVMARGRVAFGTKLVGTGDIEAATRDCRKASSDLGRLTNLFAIAWNRFELTDISLTRSTKHDPKFLDNPAGKGTKRKGAREA